MGKPTVFIDGEAGTTGIQIYSLLEGRADIELARIAHEKRKDDAERKRLLNAVDLAMLCLPDDAARAAVAMIDNPSVKVLDASTAYRVHPDWTYGFPEMAPGQADLIRRATRVTNPGCWATCFIALLRPLVEAGLIPADFPVTVSGVSGYSGAGRPLIERYEKSNPSDPKPDNYFLYGLTLTHKHLPEMRQYTGLASPPLFVPSVGAYRQGMLVHVPLLLRMLPGHVTGSDLHGVLQTRYQGEPYVHVMPFGAPPANLNPEALNGTNILELYVFENPATKQALLVARLDNLGKGASGAAVQNLSLMLGLA